MRSSRLIVFLLIWFFAAPDASAQFSGGYSSGYMRRQQERYWKSFDNARANGKDLNYYLRNEIAFGKLLGQGSFHLDRHYEDVGAKYLYDTSFGMLLKPKYAFVISANSGYPITALSENAALILSYGVDVRITRYDIDPIRMGNYTTNFIFSNMDFGAPVGIDIKSGGEAKLDKTKRFCFTLGAGFEPLWISGQMNLEYNYSTLRFMPYLKAEVGYLTNFAGFKLRASYLNGNYTQFQGEDVLDGSKVTLTNSDQFVISLAILDMVRYWDQ